MKRKMFHVTEEMGDTGLHKILKEIHDQDRRWQRERKEKMGEGNMMATPTTLLDMGIYFVEMYGLIRSVICARKKIESSWLSL